MTTWTSITTRSAGYVVTASDYNTIAGSINHLGQSDRIVIATDQSTTSIANANWTSALTFSSEETDGAGFHSTSSNTSRLTVPTGYGGYYAVFASIYMGNGALGAVNLQLRKNAAGAVGSGTFLAQSTTPTTTTGLIVSAPHLFTMVRLTAGDYVEVFLHQASGGAISLSGSATTPHRFGLMWVSA